MNYETYEALRSLLNTQLNVNSNDILFDTTLFDSKSISYTKKVSDTTEGSYKVFEKQCIPAHIEEIVGQYINVPNIDVSEAQIGIVFDIFTRDYTTVKYEDQDKYKSVSFTNTMDAIDNMRKNLLATKYELGDVGLMFGGTDSKGTIGYSTGFKHNTIYIEADLKTLDNEVLYYAYIDDDNFIKIDKTSTSIRLSVEVSTVQKVLTVPFSTGNNIIWCWFDASGNWNLKVGSNTDSELMVVIQNNHTSIVIDNDSTFNGILYRLLVDDSVITLDDTEKAIGEVVTDPKIDLYDFTSRYTFNQKGSYTLTTNTVENCILWGKLGNAVFGFETLVPISDLQYQDDGYARQLYALGINLLISKDILFGNDTEYFLDGVQVYPIDRQHSYSLQGGSEQYINELFSKMFGEKNGKDLTQTFFYTADKSNTKLVKHITSNSLTQNQEYELVVQFPFHKETYDVIIDSGGMPTNLNTLQTFTVTYKQKDDNVE